MDLKDRDEFHLTIEEYLHGLISLIEELVNDALNAVFMKLNEDGQDWRLMR